MNKIINYLIRNKDSKDLQNVDVSFVEGTKIEDIVLHDSLEGHLNDNLIDALVVYDENGRAARIYEKMIVVLNARNMTPDEWRLFLKTEYFRQEFMQPVSLAFIEKLLKIHKVIFG